MCYNGRMKRSGLTICVVFAVVLQFLGVDLVSAVELTGEQSTAVITHCDAMTYLWIKTAISSGLTAKE